MWALGIMAGLLLPLSSSYADSSTGLPPIQKPLVSILRVIEATNQEERLIRSGKFRDAQRANIKLAVSYMLDNYRLKENIQILALYAPQDRQQQVRNAGGEAVDSLTTLLEYFDPRANSLKVGDIDRTKTDFIARALKTVRDRLGDVVDALPADEVAKAKDVIALENKMNAEEYQKYYGEPMLNAPTTTEKT